MLAFEHEGPFVFQLKSSLAPGREGTGVGEGSVAWSEAGPEAQAKAGMGDSFQRKTPNLPARL